MRDSRECRLLDVCGDLGTLLASLQLEAWKLDGRFAYSRQLYWRTGVHFGPNVDGA